MFGKKRCYNGGNQHKFKPRYDLRLPAKLKMESGSTTQIEALKSKIYIKDICVWCGRVINN